MCSHWTLIAHSIPFLLREIFYSIFFALRTTHFCFKNVFFVIFSIKNRSKFYFLVSFFFSFAACLASYGTETVMQLCHGRRRCTIAADRTNFGNPCRPESRVYLKVVYTCSKFVVLTQLHDSRETKLTHCLFYSSTKSAQGSIWCINWTGWAATNWYGTKSRRFIRWRSILSWIRSNSTSTETSSWIGNSWSIIDINWRAVNQCKSTPSVTR